jgi:RimJ/RimL family protein N-acetyltransferase
MGEVDIQPVRLETERLVLDLPMRADFEPMVAMWADPHTTRYVGGPRSRNDVWMRLLGLRGGWALLGYGYWTVREKAGGRFVGTMGFADLEPPHPCAPEAGWVFAGWAHGRGYAREALTAALAWFDTTLPGAACHCLIDADNAASRRLAEGHGFAQAGVVRFKAAPTLLLTRQAAAHTPSKSGLSTT